MTSFTILDLQSNSVTRYEMFDVAGYDEDGHPLKVGERESTTMFPFGGVCIQQHYRWSDEWRVHLCSPFPNKGWMPIKSPIHGWLMTKQQALQFAREIQP